MYANEYGIQYGMFQLPNVTNSTFEGRRGEGEGDESVSPWLGGCMLKTTLPNFSPFMMTRSPRINCWPLLKEDESTLYCACLKQLILFQPVLTI